MRTNQYFSGVSEWTSPMFWHRYIENNIFEAILTFATVSERDKDTAVKYIINQVRQEESAFTPV